MMVHSAVPLEAPAWVTVMVWGEPDTPEVVAVTVTVAVREDVLVLADAVIVNDPGVLPEEAETVSQDWLEETV